jgi:hypothetical protein
VGGDVLAINAAGDMCGYSGSGQAVIWSPSGTDTVLRDPGLYGGRAVAINAYGESVGYAYTQGNGAGLDVAMAWGPGKGNRRLFGPGGTARRARGQSATADGAKMRHPAPRCDAGLDVRIIVLELADRGLGAQQGHAALPSSLKDAASVAGLIHTTKAMVAEDSEKEAPAAPGGHGLLIS